ncbi:MAG: MFS transporter [Actinobacteria bacterium]|nr:MFS transporter [Actinomycetota bacterium]
MSSEKEKQRERAQRHLGIMGTDAPPEPPLATVVKSSPAGWYPLVALSLLGLIDALDLQAFAVLGPEIKRAFSLTNVELGLISALQGLAVVFGALPLAALATRRSRAMIIKVSAIAWGILQILAGVVRGKFELGAVRTLRGLSDSSRQAVFLPLLTDSYPPEGRNRVFGAYFALATLGTVIGPGVIGFLGGILDLSFRVVIPLTGLLTFAAAAFAFKLRDPGYGRFDTDRIREDLRAETPVDKDEEDVGTGAEQEVALHFGEAFQRLLAIGTLYRILIGLAVVGVGLFGGGTFITLFVERQYGLDPFGRGLVLSLFGAASATGYALGGKFGERLFRRDPQRVLQMLGIMLGAYGLLLSISVFQPNIYLFSLAHSVASAAVAAVIPATFNVVSAIVPPRLRGYSFAVQGIYIGFVGGLMGSVLIGSIADRAGYQVALSLVVIPSVIGGWIMARAGSTFQEDLDLLTDEIIEDETVNALRTSGAELPLLEVRNCDFSYGQVQVLFDVDFTVEEGSIVALLGTNGAGKSTLLKVISGLGTPRRGAVRFLGQNVTYLGAERRVRLGIVHIPSGRPVFPSLSVIENLRMAGYSYGNDLASVERGIDSALDLFPRLAERRSQRAGTLSGGEQQMLALARAQILRLKLLCIDELSLGLAPAVVGELLEALRKIHEQGTTIVLVEQSVNVALLVAQHAYFMEKGEIKFSGPAKKLLKRDDLLRSVFLKGAAQAVGTLKGKSR